MNAEDKGTSLKAENFYARLGAINEPGADGFSRRISDMPTRELTIADGAGRAAFTARTADTPEAADRHIKAGGFRRTGEWVDGVCTVERVPAAETRRKRLIIGTSLFAAFVAIVASCSGLAAAGSTKPSPSAPPSIAPPFTASGTLTVESTSIQRDIVNVFDNSDNNCQPTGGYKDLALDTAVVVTGNGGRPVATGRIKNGKQSAKPANCVLTWEVFDVPSGEYSYTLNFGHRDPIKLTEQELRDGYKGSIGDGS